MRCCEYGPRGLIHNTYFLLNLHIGSKTRVLHYNKLKRPPSDKRYRLFGAFVSYKENEVL
jgi:hypothetical protein